MSMVLEGAASPCGEAEPRGFGGALGKGGRRMKRDWRAFGFGLGLGLFVFITGGGLLAVDYQGRKMSFGDDTPVAQVVERDGRARLTVKAFGREQSWDVTELEEAWDLIRDFTCIPHD